MAWYWVSALFTALLVTPVMVLAQEARDPMLPPRTVGSQGNDPAAAGWVAEETLPPVQQIVLRQGKHYVVSQGRHLGAGERLGPARISRISDSAVWVSLNGQTLRIPLYPGIEKLQPPQDAGLAPKGTPRPKKHPPPQHKEAA